jgi:copper(I)-binding protein
MFKTILPALALALSAAIASTQTTLAQTEATGGATHAQVKTDAAATWRLGDLTISEAYSRATLPNAPVGGGFLTITNTGAEEDRLIGASSEAAGHMEVHEMAMQGEVMRMRQLPDGLPIPSGETVVLKPGGYHLMLMELKRPLVEGETVPVTLTFEKAGSIEIPFAVRAPNAGGRNKMGHGSMDHGSLSGDKVAVASIQPAARAASGGLAVLE